MNPAYPTARTCPIDPETGKFQSDVAEFAYVNEAAKLGITREQFRLVLQAHNFAEDKSDAEYRKFRAAREKEVSEKRLLHFVELAKSGRNNFASYGEKVARQLATAILGNLGSLDETAAAGMIEFAHLVRHDFPRAVRLI